MRRTSRRRWARTSTPDGRLAGAQDDRDGTALLGVVDVDRQKAALVIVGVEQRKLLMAVRHVAGVVDVEGDARRRRCVGGHPLVDERVGQANDVLQPGRVFEPRQGRLRAQVAPAVGQPAAGELEGRIGAQDVEIVGVLVAAADRKHPGADHVGDRMGDARGIAPIGNAARQTLGYAQTPLRHRQQHHAAVRGHPPAVERGCDFLALDGWKREQRNRIVSHGGRGGRESAQRVGVSNQILRDSRSLSYGRQPRKSPVMNKTG